MATRPQSVVIGDSGFAADGGHKWSHLRLPRGTGFLTSISCPSAARCTAVGSGGAYHVLAFAVSTASGGRAWTRGIMPQKSPALLAVPCPTSSTCFTVGNSQGPYILVTTDAGKRWRESLHPNANELPRFNELVAISCPSAKTCAAAGIAHPLGTGISPTRFLLATSNGGSTWPAQIRQGRVQRTSERVLLANPPLRRGRQLVDLYWQPKPVH